jgi:hypothetical protein
VSISINQIKRPITIRSEQGEVTNHRVARLALRERRKLAQMARVLVEDALDVREKELGLPAIEDDKEYQAAIKA